MSPFPAAHTFVKSLADTFKSAALDEIEECRARIIPSRAQHSFVMRGTDELFLSYISVFNMGNYRQQLTTAQLPYEVMKGDKGLLSKILSDGHCKVSICKGLDTGHPKHVAAKAQLTDIQVIINRSIAPAHLDKSYPEFMPFYLYGTGSQQHIDHMLLRAPNAQLSAARVTLSLEKPISSLAKPDGGLLSRLIAIADTTPEDAMQPFNADHEPSFFIPRRELPVAIYQDPYDPSHPGPGLLKDLGPPIASGIMTLGAGVFVDYTLVNQEPGVTLDVKHAKAKAPGAPDITHHIGMPAVGERYSITPTDMAAVFNQLVAHHPADNYSRKMATRAGWRDGLHEELANRKLEKA